MQPIRCACYASAALRGVVREFYDPVVVANAIIFAAGLFAWTFLEYVIHGWLAHRWQSFAAPLHDVHHRDPHAVFAVGAWIPTVAIFLALAALFGSAPGVVFIGGIVAGFFSYEALHYRFHFVRPATQWEDRMRARHLAHHRYASEAIYGVSTRLWDRVFGTEPDGAEMHRLAERTAGTAPLAGRSNVRLLATLGRRAR
ncbi:MAG: sterol desaturase family protein [Candidatus Binataceae bacterium]